MANRERGETSITLGEDSFTLRFGWNQIAEVEDLLGLAFFADIVPKFSKPMTIRAGEWRALFWAALRGGGHTDMTLLQAGDLMNEIGISEVGSTIGEAVSRSFPDVAAGAGENPQ